MAKETPRPELKQVKLPPLFSDDFEIRQPRMLFWDLENSPNLGYIWGKWQQNVIKYVDEWYLLSFSVKWMHGKQITKCLADYDGYKMGDKDDSALVADLSSYLNQADVIIAHNGDRFDVRKLYTRFIELGIDPPQPAKTVDTLKVARKRFAFNSNKLDDIGRRLGVGRKMVHNGFELWESCMAGDPKAWNKMKKYNAQDVRLLEAVYFKMLPYIDNHPNMNVLMNRAAGCPRCCGTNVSPAGYRITNTGRARRFFCSDCKAYVTATPRKTTEIR
jgi:hypothetical protein